MIIIVGYVSVVSILFLISATPSAKFSWFSVQRVFVQWQFLSFYDKVYNVERNWLKLRHVALLLHIHDICVCWNCVGPIPLSVFNAVFQRFITNI